MKQIVLLVFLAVLCSCGQDRKNKIDYFGENPPGETPKVFAKDIISIDNRWEGNLNFTADGREIYFNVFEDSTKTIYSSVLTDEGWSTPKPLRQLKGQNTWEPFITWDMERLYFVSDKAPGKPEWDGRIWYMDRENLQEWSEPEYFDLKVTPKMGFWFPNVTKNGKLYFGAALKNIDSVGSGDMYRINLESKEVSLLQNLCSENEDWDPFVAPDGSYVLWASDRSGGYGGTDLYVSFKDANGEWEQPKNLGPKINTEVYEVAPRITPDGKHLFFDRPIKGTQDIYWVSTAVIEQLKR